MLNFLLSSKKQSTDNYTNIHSDFHSCQNIFKNSILEIEHGFDPDLNEKDDMIHAHRYKLSFNDHQIKFLEVYFNVCTLFFYPN